MRYTIIILTLHLYSFCSGQALMTVDHTKAVIGDQIKATIKTNLSNGREWINTKEMWPDSSNQYEVISGPEITHDDASSMNATWTIALFDTGWVTLPSLPLLIKFNDQIDTIYTNDVPIQVKPVEPD